MKPNKSILLLAVLTFAFACSIWKKNDPDQDIRAFITDFANQLNQDDKVVMKFFDARQSKESIVSALEVLQNKNLDHLHCAMSANLATISHEQMGVKVEIPVVLTSVELPDSLREETSITLWLESTEGHFVITKLEGEKFYNDYLYIKHQVSLALNSALELADRKVFFDQAHALQQQYDTIIWYVHYNGKTAYYAVKGHWNNYFIDDSEHPVEYAMGLVDETGTPIVPLEYDLVGTPGMLADNLIEVKKNGLVGIYTMDGNKLVEPAYDWIIPYQEPGIWALVKRDSTYGWLSDTYQYNDGLPAGEAKRFISNFEYLPQGVTLSKDEQSMAEIPTENYIGYGIVMPPTYWTSTGIFSEIMPGFTKSENLYNGYREYVTANHSFVESVISNINVLITTVKERYLEGREEFYEHDEITFVTTKGEALHTEKLYSTGEMSFTRKDSSLLEIKTITSPDTEYYGEEYSGAELSVPQYVYFSIDENRSISRLQSNRQYPQTEFIKLDSAYLSGDFVIFNAETGNRENATFLSDGTIREMRDEILASYGYTFEDEATAERYKYYNWYQARYTSYSDITDQMSDIDRYNLAFLERIVGTRDKQPT